MSIATETKVVTLGEKVAELEATIKSERATALMAVDMLAQRVNKLEAQLELLIAMRKPGPKPKDSHGG